VHSYPSNPGTGLRDLAEEALGGQVVGVGEQPDVVGPDAGQRVEHADGVRRGPQRLLDEQLW
jgi:hypothetical protein